MIIIYKLSPDPVKVGTYDNGIVKINEIERAMSEEDVLMRFNRGYYRCGYDS